MIGVQIITLHCIVISGNEHEREMQCLKFKLTNTYIVWNMHTGKCRNTLQYVQFMQFVGTEFYCYCLQLHRNAACDVDVEWMRNARKFQFDLG